LPTREGLGDFEHSISVTWRWGMPATAPPSCSRRGGTAADQQAPLGLARGERQAAAPTAASTGRRAARWPGGSGQIPCGRVQCLMLVSSSRARRAAGLYAATAGGIAPYRTSQEAAPTDRPDW